MEDRNRFQAADTDGDGLLSHQEYKTLLNPSENPKLMKLSIDKIMDRHDKDKDFQLDEKEFKSYCKNLYFPIHSVISVIQFIALRN